MTSSLDRYAHEVSERIGRPVFCSLTLSERGTLRQVASSDPRAAACDRVETRDGEGPCITAMGQLSSVLLEDLRSGTRWPAWRVDDDLTVALNVYSEELATWRHDELVAIDVYVQGLAADLRTRDARVPGGES